MPPAHHDTVRDDSYDTGSDTVSGSRPEIYSYDSRFAAVQNHDRCPRLDGMHLFMSFVGCCGTLMAGSGLSEVLSVAFAGVKKMFSGKKFPQNVRALRMVAEEILREFVNDVESPEDLIYKLERAAAKNPTAKLWIDCLLKPVLIMMLYIRAEREGEFLLHLGAIELMLPFSLPSVISIMLGMPHIISKSMKALPQHVLQHFIKMTTL